jgi:hypothetical protein
MGHLLITLALLHSLDTAETAVALRHGARERDPIFFGSQSMAVIAPLGAAYATAGAIGLVKLSHHKPRLAKALAWIDLGVEAVVIGMNARVLAEQARRR